MLCWSPTDWSEIVTDIGSAFNDRVDRRLQEMRSEAAVEANSIVSQAILAGGLNSGRRIAMHLTATRAQIVRAIEWSLIEAGRLPGNSTMWQQFVPPHLSTRLKAHLDSLIVGIKRTGMPEAVEVEIQSERKALSAMIDAELNDFKLGLWHPRSAPGSDQATVTNVVNVGGSQFGPIQQAGANAAQNASFEMSTSEVNAALDQLVEALHNAPVDAATSLELTAEADTIRLQLKRAQPNRAVIHAAVKGMWDIAKNVAGNLLTPQVVALAAAVGLKLAT